MRILLIHDIDNWSFHNTGRNLARASATLNKGHKFRLRSRADWAGRRETLIRDLAWADLHLFFWRFDLIAAIEMLAARPADRNALAALLARRITLSVVYDHLYDSEEALGQMGNPFQLSDLNAVCSGTLGLHYASQPHLFAPDAELIDGVDIERFQPRKQPRRPGPLRVGWVGNSDWGIRIGPDMKGFHGIFQPAMTVLEAEGTARAHVADRVTRPVRHDDMPEFYRDIDVLVCTSQIEGTPNPVLEAMASGVAVVSTDVGVVRDVFGAIQQQFVIPRDADSLVTALRRLAHDPQLLARLQAENRDRRELLAWEARFAAWQSLFERAEDMLNDPGRIADKEDRLRARMGAPISRLARIRRHILASRIGYQIYAHMADCHPVIVAKLHNRLR